MQIKLKEYSSNKSEYFKIKLTAKYFGLALLLVLIIFSIIYLPYINTRKVIYSNSGQENNYYF